MRRLTLLIGLTALATTAFGWYWNTRAPRSFVSDGTQFHKGKCPGCGLPAVYRDSEVGKKTKCLRCSREWAYTRAGQGGPPDFLFPVVMAGIVAALLGVWFFLSRSTWVREDGRYICRCPSCNRKLRFTGSQAGRTGTCPRCDRAFVFPTSAEPAN